jgi:hypothetical protein
MRQRLTTILAATAAAGLTALAVTVAAPAANDSGEGDGVRDGKVVRTEGPTPEALISCLASHGATGVPGADEDAGRALKQWIVAHQSDASVRGALEACDVYFDDKRPKHGDPDDAVACPAPAPAAAKRNALRGPASATGE